MPGSIGLTAFIGGLILALVLLYAVVMNRRRSADDRRRTEEATRANIKAMDREDKRTDPDTNTF